MDKKIRPRKAVMAFAREMEQVLRENDFKGGWKTIPYSLFDQLVRKTFGLNVVLHTKHNDHEAIRRKCADIANYAMMIADWNGLQGGKDDHPNPKRD